MATLLGRCLSSTPARAGWTQPNPTAVPAPTFDPCSRRVDRSTPTTWAYVSLQPLLAQGGLSAVGGIAQALASTPARAGWTKGRPYLQRSLSFNPCSRRVDTCDVLLGHALLLQPMLAQGGLLGLCANAAEMPSTPARAGWTPTCFAAPVGLSFNPCSRRVDGHRNTPRAAASLQPLLAQGGPFA